MLLQEFIYKMLAEKIEGSWGDRVYPQVLPQGVQFPALTYQIVSQPADNTLSGTNNYFSVRAQITPFTNDYLEGLQIKRELRDVLIGFDVSEIPEISVDSIMILQEMELSEPNTSVFYFPVDINIKGRN